MTVIVFGSEFQRYIVLPSCNATMLARFILGELKNTYDSSSECTREELQCSTWTPKEIVLKFDSSFRKFQF